MDFFIKNKVAGSIIIILVILNVVLISLFWYREFRRPDIGFRDQPRSERPERIMGFVKQELGLTDEQAEQFTAQRRKLYDEMDPLLKQIHDLRMKLTEAIFADQPEKDTVYSLISRISATEQQREEAMFNHIQQLRAICSPEQQQKLRKLMREVMMHSRQEMHREPREHRPGEREHPRPD